MSHITYASKFLMIKPNLRKTNSNKIGTCRRTKKGVGREERQWRKF